MTEPQIKIEWVERRGGIDGAWGLYGEAEISDGTAKFFLHGQYLSWTVLPKGRKGSRWAVETFENFDEAVTALTPRLEDQAVQAIGIQMTAADVDRLSRGTPPAGRFAAAEELAKTATP